MPSDSAAWQALARQQEMAELAPLYVVLRRGIIPMALVVIGMATWALGAPDWLIGVAVGGSLGPLFALERYLFVRWVLKQRERES